MGAMKRLSEMLDDMFRPMCPTCGLIPPKTGEEKFCFYCEMAADFCQCDTSHMCRCRR